MSKTEYDFNNVENLYVFIDHQATAGTWSVFAALGLRLTFLYEKGVVLNVCANGKISTFNLPTGTSLGSNWKESKLSGVYEFHESAEFSDIEEILVDFIERYGIPALKLPWEEFYQGAIDEVDEDADEEDLEVGDLALLEAQKLIEGDVSDPLWSSIALDYGDNYLPKDCDFHRFEAMTSDLEDENWIVIWNECCGTCAGGSIRDRRGEPGYAEAPAFVVYGQNADVYFAPDGSIHDYLHYPDELGKGREMELAKEYGFKVTDQGDGFFVFN